MFAENFNDMRKRIDTKTRSRLASVRLVSAEYAGENKIKLSYDNGVSGVLDFKPIFLKTIQTINCPDCEVEFRKYFEEDLFKRFRFDANFLHWDYKIGYNAQMLYSLCIKDEEFLEMINKPIPTIKVDLDVPPYYN